MNDAFRMLKNNIGIITPTEDYRIAFQSLFTDTKALDSMIAASQDDFMIGTPDMYRGVHKDLIILAPMKNSKQQGIGLLNQSSFINLALTRGKFVWVIGSSPTLL